MFFATIHPLLVPFAVALLLTGVVFEFYGWLQHEESARMAGSVNIRLGLGFACVAVIVGFLGVIGISDLFSEAPRKSEAMEASEILGSTRCQSPNPKFILIKISGFPSCQVVKEILRPTLG